MKNLMNDLKDKNFQRVYLLFGSEAYLVRLYEDKLRRALLTEGEQTMNMEVFTGKTAAVEDIFNAANTLPFMAEYRLILVRDSGLFAPGRKADSTKAGEYLKDLSPTTVLVFVEENVDKRSAVYKAVQKQGRCVEFKTPAESELTQWMIREFTKAGLELPKPQAVYLYRVVSGDMSLLQREIEKLVAYKGGSGVIEGADIDAVCTKSLETRIFSLIDAIAAKNPTKALEIYQNLMLMRESPIMILSLIIRQFRLILQCSEMAGQGTGEIASALGIRPFVVSECLKQSRNFDKKMLMQAMKDCLDTDISIKTGKMGDALAVELLIIKYAANVAQG